MSIEKDSGFWPGLDLPNLKLGGMNVFEQTTAGANGSKVTTPGLANYGTDFAKLALAWNQGNKEYEQAEKAMEISQQQSYMEALMKLDQYEGQKNVNNASFASSAAHAADPNYTAADAFETQSAFMNQQNGIRRPDGSVYAPITIPDKYNTRQELSGVPGQEAATAPGHVTSANSRATGHPPKKPSSFAGAAPQNTQRLA